MIGQPRGPPVKVFRAGISAPLNAVPSKLFHCLGEAAMTGSCERCFGPESRAARRYDRTVHGRPYKLISYDSRNINGIRGVVPSTNPCKTVGNLMIGRAFPALFALLVLSPVPALADTDHWSKSYQIEDKL